MELEIKHHADGTRYVRPYLGSNAVTGRPIRPYHRFPDAKTDEEAMEMAKRWLAEVAPSADVGTTHRLGDLLARYVRWVEENGKSANTVKTYRTFLRYAEPLADKPARYVKTYELEMLYHHLLAPKEEGGAGLGNNSVITFHWFLSGAFGWMCSVGAADVNPARDATPPEPGVYEAVALEGEDFPTMAAVLKGLAEEPLQGLHAHDALMAQTAYGAWLALNTGLRCGEVCALRRRDAQLFRKVLHVGGTIVENGDGAWRQARTKGKRDRNVALSDEACEMARGHETLVAAAFGTARRELGAPICPNRRGSWIRPSSMSACFREICDGHGMPRGVTFHSLRHTHATWLLLNGADPKTVSERLGHSSVAVTLAIYAHVLPGRDAQAAELFSRVAKDAGEW